MKNLKPTSLGTRRRTNAILLVGLALSVGLFGIGLLKPAAASPDFAITTSPSSLTIFPGACATKTIIVASLGTFTGIVSLSTTVAPGFTASISPASILVPAGGSATATKTVCISQPIPPGSYTETITGVSGSLSHTITETDTVPSTASDFSMTPNPSSLTIPAGSCANKTITITAIGNFSGTISLTTTVSGGLTASLSQSSVTLPPSPQNVTKTVCASTAVPAGNYVETVTGIDVTGLIHSFNETDIVTSTSDFTLATSTPSLTIPQGGCASKTITITGVNNYTGTIFLSTSIVPAGLTATLSPASFTLPPSPQTATKTVCASTSTPPGSYIETITGTDLNGLTHTINETDTVIPRGDFTLVSSTLSLTIPQGSCASKTITITGINNYTGTIFLSTSIVPAGLTATLSPASFTLPPSPQTATKTVCASTSTPPGSYTETITGTDLTGLTHTINETDTVPPSIRTPCFFFTLNGKPVSQNYCNPRANDLKIDFKPLATAGCFIQFSSNGVLNGGPRICPQPANDIEIFWNMTPNSTIITKCTWTRNERPLPFPCPVPPGSNDFRFFAAGGITQVFWTINGVLMLPPILPPAAVLANDVEFFFV